MSGPTQYPALRDLSPAAQAAAAWFKALGRGLRTCRIYRSGNPLANQVRGQLYEQLSRNLKDHGSWVLRIAPSEIFLRDEPIVRPSVRTDDPDYLPGQEESLPFVFYRDGVRGMTFQPEVPQADFDSFFAAMRAATAGPLTHDDLVTLLWQANTTRIIIEALPATQTIYLSSRRPASAESGGHQGQSYAWNAAGEELRADIGQIAGMAQGLHRDTFDDWALADAPAETPDAFAALTRGMQFTRARFLADWANECSRPWTEEVPPLFRRVLEIDRSIETREALSQAVVTWVAAAVQRCAWNESREALTLLRELDPSGAISAAPLTTALAGLDTGDITYAVDESEPGEQAQCFGLLVAIGRPALDLACAMMAKANKARTRAAACTMLCYMCSGEPELLGRYLSDSRWYVVRNAVFVLGQIGGTGVVGMLRAAAFHTESRVRRQVIQSLGSVPRSDALPILLGQLDTRDPGLLAAALAMLTRQKDAQVARAIIKQIEAPDFEVRSEENQRALFHALAEVAADESVTALEALITRGGWFARRTLTRTAAARTLARIRTPRAMAVLDAGLRSRSEVVRAACLEAINMRVAA